MDLYTQSRDPEALKARCWAELLAYGCIVPWLEDRAREIAGEVEVERLKDVYCDLPR